MASRVGEGGPERGRPRTGDRSPRARVAGGSAHLASVTHRLNVWPPTSNRPQVVVTERPSTPRNVSPAESSPEAWPFTSIRPVPSVVTARRTTSLSPTDVDPSTGGDVGGGDVGGGEVGGGEVGGGDVGLTPTVGLTNIPGGENGSLPRNASSTGGVSRGVGVAVAPGEGSSALGPGPAGGSTACSSSPPPSTNR